MLAKKGAFVRLVYNLLLLIEFEGRVEETLEMGLIRYSKNLFDLGFLTFEIQSYQV